MLWAVDLIGRKIVALPPGSARETAQIGTVAFGLTPQESQRRHAQGMLFCGTQCESWRFAVERLGGIPFEIVTGSMFPLLAPGEKVWIEPVRHRLAVGRVILMIRDDRLVLHRVRAMRPDVVITQGDSSAEPDPPLPRDQVIGLATRRHCQHAEAIWSRPVVALELGSPPAPLAPVGDDLDAQLRLRFASAFSTSAGPLPVLGPQTLAWPAVRRHVRLPAERGVICATDAAFSSVTAPEPRHLEKLAERLLEIDRLARAWQVDTVTFEALPPPLLDRFRGRPGWVTRSLKVPCVDPRAWAPSADVRRALRKAASLGVRWVRVDGPEELASVRRTVDDLGLGPRDAEAQVEMQVSFMAHACRAGRGIGLLAMQADQVIGGMFGLLLGFHVYMLMHGYLREHVRAQPNDVLYAALVEVAREVGATHLFWGACDAEDHGLLRMKRKYSTEVLDRPALHWVGKLMRH